MSAEREAQWENECDNERYCMRRNQHPAVIFRLRKKDLKADKLIFSS
jgi:hypothetical protein